MTKDKALSKAQSVKFNELFETTLCWGDENCIGLFRNLLDGTVDHDSHELNYLTTCVQEEHGQIEVLAFDGCSYFDLIGYVPLNSKTKSTFKEIVKCLLSGGTLNDISKFTE